MGCNCFIKPLYYLALLLTILMMVPLGAYADEEAPDDAEALFDMPLSQLMALEITAPGTLTEKNPLKTPASVTIITADDIVKTPARNLLDLMEIYVPGMIYMNHSVGPEPGIRGILADRPYKFLVNLNGININIKAHYGARLELLNWDLMDIARVEIIRGPGSVTYGPGAIGGVINIYTKSAQEAEGLQGGFQHWDKYDSTGGYASYGSQSEDMDFLGYISYVDTPGTRPDLFGVGSSGAGYVGTATGPTTRPPATYMADFFDKPQVKAHVDAHFKNNWRIWARYSNESTSVIQGTATKFVVNGRYQDFRLSKYEYAQLAIENHRPLGDLFELKSALGYSSINVHDIQKHNTDGINDMANIGWIWSENELYIRSMLNFTSSEEVVKAGIGFEGSYDTFRPAWGKDEDDGLRMSDGIISGPTSDAYGTGTRQYDESSNRYFPVGHGWDTYSYALLGEVNWQIFPQSTALLSLRADKHKFTDMMYSPRFAWIQELSQDHFLKFIYQLSVRRNTEEELYMNHINGMDNDPEELKAFEAIYSGKIGESFTHQVSAFFNVDDVIAWDWGQRRAAPIGTLKTWGLELEGKLQKDHYTIGVNHSYVKQIEWNLDDSVSVSGISYSDYMQTATDDNTVIITSKGNDLNNWSTHATKLFANRDFLDGKLTLHGDMRILWGFDGRKDGLEALEEAGGNTADIDEIRDHDAYETEVTADLSLRYRICKWSDVILYLQNIPVLGDNKRYSYSSGFKRSYPDKVSWIEEPMAFGIRYLMKFK